MRTRQLAETDQTVTLARFYRGTIDASKDAHIVAIVIAAGGEEISCDFDGKSHERDLGFADKLDDTMRQRFEAIENVRAVAQ
jgi:hypothetical protein